MSPRDSRQPTTDAHRKEIKTRKKNRNGKNHLSQTRKCTIFLPTPTTHLLGFPCLMRSWSVGQQKGLGRAT